MTSHPSTRPGTLAALAAAGVVLGAVATSSNPVFVRLSDVPKTASAFHRMAWALPAISRCSCSAVHSSPAIWRPCTRR